MTEPPPPPTLDDIIALVRERTGYTESLDEHTSLQDDVGMYGDDMSDLIYTFTDRFGVDMTGYRYYFHTGDEGYNPFWVLFPPPNVRVQQIPITPALLLESARRKVWAVEYPPHKLPKVRWDVVCMWVVVTLLFVFGVWGCCAQLFR